MLGCADCRLDDKSLSGQEDWVLYGADDRSVPLKGITLSKLRALCVRTIKILALFTKRKQLTNVTPIHGNHFYVLASTASSEPSSDGPVLVGVCIYLKRVSNYSPGWHYQPYLRNDGIYMEEFYIITHFGDWGQP